MPSLFDIKPEVLTAICDALSHSLGISITLVDNSGNPVLPETTPAGRRMVAAVCQDYHFIDGSPVKKKVCDVWDRDACRELDTENYSAINPYVKECALGFQCIAVPIYSGGKRVGAIFGGERRIRNPRRKILSKKYSRAKELLSSWDRNFSGSINSINQEYSIKTHKQLWEESFDDSNTITVETFEKIKDYLCSFSLVLSSFLGNGIFIVEERGIGAVVDSAEKRIAEIESIFELVTPQFENRLFVDNKRNKDARLTRQAKCKTRQDVNRFFSLIISGIPYIHKWLWELIDPEPHYTTVMAERSRIRFIEGF